MSSFRPLSVVHWGLDGFCYFHQSKWPLRHWGKIEQFSPQNLTNTVWSFAKARPRAVRSQSGRVPVGSTRWWSSTPPCWRPFGLLGIPEAVKPYLVVSPTSWDHPQWNQVWNQWKPMKPNDRSLVHPGIESLAGGIQCAEFAVPPVCMSNLLIKSLFEKHALHITSYHCINDYIYDNLVQQ